MAWRVGGPGGAGWGNRVPPERACPRLAKGPQVPSSPSLEPRDLRQERPTPMVHGEKKERGWGGPGPGGAAGREQTLSLMAASASPSSDPAWLGSCHHVGREQLEPWGQPGRGEATTGAQNHRDPELTRDLAKIWGSHCPPRPCPAQRAGGTGYTGHPQLQTLWSE